MRFGVTIVGFAALLLAGCGEAGVGEGATVTAYVTAPLCGQARMELVRDGGRSGGLRVRLVCLPDPRARGKLDLATAGANARRATEDSSSIAYISEPDSAAAAASNPILETVEVPQLSTSSGRAAMQKLLAALRQAGNASNLRQAMTHTLAGG
jgi:branched-chain amino acid transport system substrate-binding protein